ncbi:MAG: LytR C-terminal domain-containing protein [Patescibacteria group bacterium]|jgi:hypothetical protein
MAKFFDLNKKNEPDSADEKTAKTVDSSEKHIDTESEKVENVAIEHGAAFTDAPSEPENDKAEPKEDKPEHSQSVAVKPEIDEDEPKAPTIPRATAEMAPAQKIPPAQSIMPPVIKSSKKQKWITAFLSIILISLLALLVSQAVIFYNNSQTTTTASPSTTTSATPTATGTATPSISPSTTTTATPSSTALTKASVTVKVLNGGGVTGAATKASTVITAAGFTVSSTANAKSYSYTTSYVYYKNANEKDLATELAAALTGYSVTAKVDATMATSDTELVVVIGKK